MDDIYFSISVILNLILGMYFIGNFKKPPPKKVKNEKAALYIAPLIIGGLFGFIGNIFATSLLDIQNTISPSYSGLIFISSAVAFIGVLLFLYKYFNEAIG